MVNVYPNPREQIKEALQTLNYPVKGEYPAGKQTLPLITFSQVANAYLSSSTARLVYQVDAWANSFDKVVEMAGEINGIMQGLNFRRTYESPDSTARQNVELYHKALTFQTTADLIFARFLN